MPRGGHKVKTPKPGQFDAPPPVRVSAVTSLFSKPTRTNTDWKPAVPTLNFRSKTFSETVSVVPEPTQPPAREPSFQDVAVESTVIKLELPLESITIQSDLEHDENEATSSNLPDELEIPVRPQPSRTPSNQSIGDEDLDETNLDPSEDLMLEETQSISSSLYSRDSSSIYSRRDSASLYSSASSIYSSGASTYSYDDCGLDEQSAIQYQQRARAAAIRRQEALDPAARERSSMARKAAMFKNSQLRPDLPSFSTSLPVWSMVCRAVYASQDCYDSHALSRRGSYTPADSCKDIKAMIVDEMLIDDSKVVIVAIRGTQFKSISDWAVNKAANPAKPVGFLDDEENACHEGFVKVTKAMLGQVASLLQQHPASSEKPNLLFTGHSAGGAVAAMLYSHMMSTSVTSELTALAGLFPSINCVTFGAPPLSQTPLPRRGSGVFLSFANQGDPVLRLSDAAYLKSLAKLMTASPPASVAPAPKVKVVRRSRGTGVVRQTVSAGPSTPWEELPMWPTPPVPLTNAGDVILLRDNESGSATASLVTPDDLSDAIFGDLAQHTCEMYIRRVKEMSLSAMIGRI